MSDSEYQNMILCYYSDMEYFAAHLTKNRDDAKDLTQQTILKALQHKNKYKENKYIKSWLFVIMKNIFIDQKRKEKNTAFDYNVDDLIISEPENITTKLTLDEILVYLNKKYKSKIITPLILNAKGIKYEEISKEYNVNINTIKSRIKRVREDLRKRYNL